MIDLGMVDARVAGVRSANGPVPAYADARRSPVRVGLGTAVVSVVAAASLLNGSVARSAPELPPPLTVQVAGPATFAIDGRMLYVAHGSSGVTGYTIADLRPRWTAPVSLSAPMFVTSSSAGDVVTLASIAAQSDVIALDAATGTVRWRAPGYPIWQSPGGGRLVLGWSTPADESDTARQPRRLQGIDADTGKVLWSRTVASFEDEDLTLVRGDDGDGDGADAGGDGSTGLALLTRFGHDPEAVDFGSGRVRVLAGFPPMNALRVARDLLLGVPATAPGTVTAYDAGSLRPQWTVREADLLSSSACGAWLCLMGLGTTTAVDRRSGAVRWRSPWQLVSADQPAGVAPVRAVASRIGVGGLSDTAILDAEDGRVLRELPGWRLLAPVHGGRAPVARWDQATGEVSLGALDLTDLAVYPLGELRGQPSACRAGGGAVACTTAFDTVTVWQYTRPR